MERTSSVSIKFVLVLFAALMAFSVFRAATRDVTPSEAWNYDRFVGPTWEESLHRFDSNNHVLMTSLERISTTRFHLTELSLRLPALLGGALYLWAAFRVCRRWFRGRALTLAAAAMALNPLIVDALSEARGYGFSMAFWLLALDLFLQCLEELEPRKLTLSAMCLSLSIAGCLAFVVPALSLIAIFAWMIRRPLARDLYLPMLVFLFVLLAIPMNRMILGELAQGVKSWPAMVWVGVAILAAMTASRFRQRDSAVMLTAGTGVVSVLMIVLAHLLWRMPYPDRGAIYLIPLATLGLFTTFRRYPRLVILASSICLLVYIAVFPSGSYREGREFAGSRDLAKTLRALTRERHARIAVSLDLEPVMNYYRWRYRQGNWDRIERKPPAEGYDYYVLTAADAVWVERLRLRVVSRSPGIILAARQTGL